MNNLIDISDEFSIEVYVDENEAVEISSFQNKENPLNKLQKILEESLAPVVQSYKSASERFGINEAKIAFGIKIGAEGNLILSKTNVEANIQIEFLIKNNKLGAEND